MKLINETYYVFQMTSATQVYRGLVSASKSSYPQAGGETAVTAVPASVAVAPATLAPAAELEPSPAVEPASSGDVQTECRPRPLTSFEFIIQELLASFTQVEYLAPLYQALVEKASPHAVETL